MQFLLNTSAPPDIENTFGWWVDFYECGLFYWKDITIDSTDEAQIWDLKPFLHVDYDILCLIIVRTLQTSLVEALISQIFPSPLNR